MDYPETQTKGPLEELLNYVKLVKDKDYQEDSRISKIAYEKSLNSTLASLKAELEQEVQRSKALQAAAVVVPIWDQETDNVDIKTAQLRILATGYRILAKKSPVLPSSDSRLPALLAARQLNRTVSGTRESIKTTLEGVREARSNLQDELNNLSDAESLNGIFERRRGELKDSASQTERDDSHTIAVRLMDKEKLQMRTYRQDRAALGNALEDFIVERLSPLLAAEELGGPVTGSVLNITDEVLAAGFTDRGKVNKGQKTNNDHRQRRIDEMFGNLAVEGNAEIEGEAAIAGQTMRELIENLVELSFDRGSGRYLELAKENAASRFLVRSKVAVLDPRDGKKIRLVDFGKPLEDWL